MKSVRAAPNPTTSPKINVPIGRLAPPRPVYVIARDDRIGIVRAGDSRIWQEVEPELDHTSSTAARDRHAFGGGGLEGNYRALKAGAGVRLGAERIVIRMSGDDRAAFLHGMCSNDIKGLKPGGLVAALFLTERAHLIAEANVWATADALLLEMERALWPAVR